MTALVGYDGSPQSDRAIAAAAAILPDVTATVVTVWHAPWPSGDLLQQILHEREGVTVDDLAARLREIGGTEAAQTAADGASRATAAGWTATALSRESQQGVWFELDAIARELDPDLVVIGARGAGGASPLGRVADAVVRLADRPVLVVPDGTADVPADAPIVIGYDGSPLADAAIRNAAAVFPGRRAIVVHVGHMALAGTGAEIATAAGLRAEPLAVEAPLTDIVRPEGAPWSQLARVADDAQAAAIAVGARGTGALRRFLLGSTTSGLLHHARRPLLVTPPDAA